MSGHAPRVTIGLPAYNSERHLEETLEGLLTQSFTDYELIISDNASTDATGEIGRSYASKDPRVRYVCQSKNIGLAGNYNQLFRMSTGEYFKWATSDDVCEPDYLIRCVAALDADPSAVLAYPRSQFIDDSGQVLPIADPGWDLQFESACDRFEYVIRAGHWVNSIIGLIRRDTLAMTRLLPNYPGGDYALLGELSVLGRFIEIPAVLFKRRLHPQATSQIEDADVFAELITGSSDGLVLPTWARCRDHGRTILFSELSPNEKLHLGGVLLKRMKWQRQRLVHELMAVLRKLPPAARGPKKESGKDPSGSAPCEDSVLRQGDVGRVKTARREARTVRPQRDN